MWCVYDRNMVCIAIVAQATGTKCKVIIEKHCTFVANSLKPHAAFVQTQQSMSHQQILELQRLLDTWLSCREDHLTA